MDPPRDDTKMDNLPITLIVKAPNQQIEDQTIQCELTWTINKLKQHLSEVYPSKPPKHEQKLIYSGQLLNDSATLKDVLRQYEGQETHTVHLVCTPKHMKSTTTNPQMNQSNPTQPTAQNTSQVPLNNPQINRVSTENNTSTSPPQRVPNAGPWGPPMDANQYAMQLAWMQQAYIQYMTQYMQLAASSYAGGAPIGTANVGETVAQPNPNVPDQAAAAAPQPAPVRDVDNPDRDWLDIFYMLSRAMVLFSVVYFYSSPLRFICVLFLGLSLYLYQIGFFRNINNNNNNNNTTVPPEQQAAATPPEEQAPSRLMLVWTFFTTFFASLVPEIPNAA